MPSKPQTIAEGRQLFPLELSQGVDERTRPELMKGGQATVQLENFIQNQNGAWVKAPGVVQLATTDDTGSSLGNPIKAIRTPQGLGVIGNGNFYQYLEGQGTFRNKGKVRDFSVKGNYVTAAQGFYPINGVGHPVLATASNSKYDIIAYGSGYGTSVPNYEMAVYDRASGALVVKYDLTTIVITGVSTWAAATDGTFRIIFVGDRYLHMYGLGITNLNDNVVQIDTQAAWPADLTAVPSASTVSDLTVWSHAGNRPVLFDVSTDGVRSYAVFTADDSTYDIVSVDTSLTVVRKHVTNFTPKTCDVDGQGRLWVVGVDTGGTGNGRIIALPAANVAGSTTKDVTSSFVWAGVPSVGAYDDGRLGIVDNNDALTFGGTTIVKTAYYETPVPASFSTFGASNVKGFLYGWIAYSTPFYNPVTDKIYVHLVKQDGSVTVSEHVVACMTDMTAIYGPGGYGSTTVRMAAVLEPYVGESVTTTPTNTNSAGGNHLAPVRQRYVLYETYKCQAVVPLQTTRGAAAHVVYQLVPHDPKAFQSAVYENKTYFVAGGLAQTDGYGCFEQGVVDRPLTSVQDSGNIGNPNGSYSYVAVFRGMDSKGAAGVGRVYGPVSISVSSKKVDVTMQPPMVTARNDGPFFPSPVASINPGLFAELYRTVSGGTQYFLCASSQPNLTGNTVNTQQLVMSSGFSLLTVSDNMSDATLQSQPLLHRQPGTANTPLDRYVAPGGSFSVCSHKDRLFVTDPYGDRVYYSSFFVDGEDAWFNPAFSFFVHGGVGPITGLASMDGRLFVFKKDAIFVVDGDGPPEGGGNGTEFSPPQQMASCYGCVEPRSIVLTPDGLMFMSTRGIEILTRSLQVNWIGDKLQNTVEAHPVCTGAALCSDNRRVRFLLAEAEGLTASGDGVICTLDITSNSWSTERVRGIAGQQKIPVQSICTFEDNTGGVAEEQTILVAQNWVSFFDSETTQDFSQYKPSVFTTGWIKVSGPLARQRIYDIVLLCKFIDNHKLTVRLAYNYDDTFVQSYTWQPDVLSRLSLEELVMQPKIQDALAVKLQIEDGLADDFDTWPITTGKGYELLGVTFSMAPMQGIPKTSHLAKG